MNPVLIIGCGDIGERLAGRLPDAAEPLGLVRSEAGVARLRAAGIGTIQADLDAPLPDDRVPVAEAEVYYFAPPPNSGEQDTRVRSLCSWLEEPARRPQRLVYISTSAVYGDCEGGWIDETAALRPGTTRGKRRLDAERQWLGWSKRTGVPVVILRVPGIYAHDRLPVRRLREGLPVLDESESPYTNRIHADDLAAVCLAAMRNGEPGEAYNVADGQPTSMTDYFFRVADALGLPRPPVVNRDAADKVLSASMMSFLQESKRLDNRRMLGLGVELEYPNLAAGLAGVRPQDWL